MKIWVDDVRPAPKMYIWLKAVDEAKVFIQMATSNGNDTIELGIYFLRHSTSLGTSPYSKA